MAASDVITVNPGLLLLDLPSNKGIDIDKAAVERKFRDLDRFLMVKIGRSEELAILNLQGLLTLRLRRYEEAVEYFQAVLNKDPENLNALANLHYVLHHLVRRTEAEEYNKKINRLLKEKSIGAQKRNAKCLAEQAFAYAFDIHSIDDTILGTRFKKSIELYTKALEIGGSAVGSKERDDWNFCKAINAQRLFDKMFHARKTSEVVVYIDMAVKLFFEIIRSDEGDPYLQWDSWCHLGDLFRKIQKRDITKKVSAELQEFKDDPEKCMLKAMEISPNNARLLARYANFLYSRNNKDIKKPLELLQQSISLDSSEFNFYAYTLRASINMKWYVHGQEYYLLNRSAAAAPDLIFLDRAKTDYERAMSMHPTPFDLGRLGQVYHLLAKYHTEQDEAERRSLLEKALLYFTKSVEYQDGNKMNEVHIVRGCCLFDIGEYRSAVDSYKQAIECESKTETHTRNFDELFNVYLSMLREKETTEDDSILKEIACSLNMALMKYPMINMIYCIAKYRPEYNDEIKQLRRYCKHVSLSPRDMGNSSQGQPIPKGGTLKQLWNKSRRRHQYVSPREDTRAPRDLLSSTAKKEHVPHLTKVGMAVGGKENRAEDVDHSSDHRYTPGGCSDISKDVTHLASGIHSITVKDETTEMADQRSTNEKEFDFNVVYSLSQLEWVDNLVKELEDRELKGCTFDRPAVAGSYILPSYISLMKQSTVTLLILREDFKDDLKLLLLDALKNEYGSKLIPVRTDDFEVPEEISGIITCFDATNDPVNWDKLASDIKHHETASSR